MDLTQQRPHEKSAAVGPDRKVHLAQIIFRFQVFKKPTDINIISVVPLSIIVFGITQIGKCGLTLLKFSRVRGSALMMRVDAG